MTLEFEELIPEMFQVGVEAQIARLDCLFPGSNIAWITSFSSTKDSFEHVFYSTLNEDLHTFAGCPRQAQVLMERFTMMYGDVVERTYS